MNFLALLTGYLFGSFQTSYILGKTIKGADIREKGSRNAGTSNMVQTYGWKLGILTFVGDVLKIIIPLLIAKYYFHTGHVFNLLMGIGGILGHNFPFYMGFRGGKGTATTLGMLLIFDWRICLAITLILVAVALITNYIALASLISVAMIPVILYLYYHTMDTVLISIAMPAVCVYVHRSNIRNMLSNRENKISSVFKKGNKKDTNLTI
jgi:acyl-phosphate glycerol 3-phosphate acyltransferase